VAHYLPEMAGTAYEDATLRQVLDMQIGVDYSEDYADQRRTSGLLARRRLRARGPDYTGPGNYYDYLLTLRKAESTARCSNTRRSTPSVVLGHGSCHRGCARRPLERTDLVENRLRRGRLSRGGFDWNGHGGGGLSASLRDLCRFGELMRCEAHGADGSCYPGGRRGYPARIRSAKFAPAATRFCPDTLIAICGGFPTQLPGVRGRASTARGCMWRRVPRPLLRAFARIPLRRAPQRSGDLAGFRRSMPVSGGPLK